MAETRHEGPRGPKKPKAVKRRLMVSTIRTKHPYKKKYGIPEDARYSRAIPKTYRESIPLAPTPKVPKP